MRPLERKQTGSRVGGPRRRMRAGRPRSQGGFAIPKDFWISSFPPHTSAGTESALNLYSLGRIANREVHEEHFDRHCGAR
jgi:hypothetical protein